MGDQGVQMRKSDLHTYTRTTEEQQEAAAAYVASQAIDTEDLNLLFDMLGLDSR